MNRIAGWMAVLVGVGLVLCGGCESDSDDPGVPANVAGEWRGARTTAQGASYTYAVTLSQDTSVVSGTFEGGPEFASAVNGTIAGTVRGNRVVLVFTYVNGAAPGFADTWTGDVNAAGTSITGTSKPNNGAGADTFELHPL